MKGLLQGRVPGAQAASLARVLSRGQWTHDNPITVSEALELGLPISTKLPREVFELMRLYPLTAHGR